MLEWGNNWNAHTTWSLLSACGLNWSSFLLWSSSDGQVIPLVELSAKQVAFHIPFEVVEKVYPPVPEQLQLRIAYWSFPENEEDIRWDRSFAIRVVLNSWRCAICWYSANCKIFSAIYQQRTILNCWNEQFIHSLNCKIQFVSYGNHQKNLKVHKT